MSFYAKLIIEQDNQEFEATNDFNCVSQTPTKSEVVNHIVECLDNLENNEDNVIDLRGLTPTEFATQIYDNDDYTLITNFVVSDPKNWENTL